MTRRRPLSRAQARQMRSLMEDGGWSRREARGLVDAGFGEPEPEVGGDDETLETVKVRVTERALRILSGIEEPRASELGIDPEWMESTRKFHEEMQSQLKKIEEV